MKNLPARSPATRPLEEHTFVPEELIGRLHRATDATILDLMAKFTAKERASLAMFCYQKNHLRRIGLAIAATCDRPSLVQQLGTVLGDAIFTQSREGIAGADASRAAHRAKVTLARSAGGVRPPLIDVDDEPKSA